MPCWRFLRFLISDRTAGVVGGQAEATRRRTSDVAAILAIYFGVTLVSLEASGPVRSSLAWANSLGLTLSFHGDGLGLLFAIVIAAVGALIVLFSSRYFDGDARPGDSMQPCSPSWAPCLASCFPTTCSPCSCSGS